MFQRLLLTTGLCLALAFSAQSADTTPPTIASVTPAPGTVGQLTNVTVVFSEPVTGVDEGDFLIEGIAVATLVGSGTTYTFTFQQPPYGPVQIAWVLANEIRDVSVEANAFNASAPGASWQYQLVDQTGPTIAASFPAAGASVRALTQIEVRFNEGVEGVSAGDLLVNGQAATNLVALPDGGYLFQFAQPAAGTVNISWSAAHGITDVSPVRHAFTPAGWSYQLDPTATLGDLVINEFMASNVSTNGLADEDLEQSDWIEIRNRGTNSVNLAGWSLSDDPDVPGMWVFPSRVLGPGQYIVVFASGKDRRAPVGANRFHTNFRLGTGGEHLGLYSPDSPRALVSGFVAYPEQRNDYSYGTDPSGNLRYFKPGTPGASNGVSSVSGVVESVHFSVERGHFTGPFDLHLSTPTPKAIIRVTFDGSEPTDFNGLLYAGPLRITSNSIVRAAAFRPNMLPSRVGTHTYLFNQTAAIRSLPILSIVTASNNLIGRTGIIGMNGGSRAGDGLFITNNPATDYHNPSAHGIAWERPVSAEWIRLDGQAGFQIDCGIRVMASDWQRPRLLPNGNGDKFFSFRLYFRSDYGPGTLDHPFFTNTSVQTFDQLVLRAGYNDRINAFIIDEMTRRLSANMGQVASHGGLMNFFVNGQYRLYYNPTERLHEEMLQAHHGGSEEWDVVGPAFATGAEELGVIDGDRTSFNALHNFINTQNAGSQAIYQQVTQRLDVVNFVDYLLLNVYAASGDWPANNWRAGKDRGTNGIWRFYVWDAEWALGMNGSRDVNRNTFLESGGGPGDSGLNSTGNSEIARMYQRLRAQPEFRLLWADRIHKHFFNNGALMNHNLTNVFEALRSEMAGVLPGMSLDIRNRWIAGRRPVVMQHFNQFGLLASSNAPVFSQHGGRVAPGYALTMTSSNIPNSVIYYTTNGVDPRVMFTSAVSPAAQAYSVGTPLPLQQSTIVKARSLMDGTNWSALTEARFDVGFLGVPLRVTEINYNPPGGNGFEFIELRNVGPATLDLGGMFFEGITFTFPEGTLLAAGTTIVLASDTDPNGFAARYPGVQVGGRFSGNLANGGERLTLRDRNSRIILTVDFDDENGWATAADGQGSSLEINDSLGDPDDPSNWRASTQQYGTPGQTTTAPGIPAVRINELMADNLTAVTNGTTYPDWIELHNASGAAVNLAGWSLSDDGDPRKYVFPVGATIPAGGYLVVWCDGVTNTTPGLHTGFALGRNGETISLYNTSTTRVDAVTYGLQVSDYSVGRVSGEWRLTVPTPNAANVAATIGTAANLAINEWLANPLPGGDDWVELVNRTNAPVSLEGLYLGVAGGSHRITSLSYAPANGFVQILFDENPGSDHVDLRLPGTGGTIVLYDEAALEVSRVTYGVQAEGITQGRLPDGTGVITNFPGSPSPGASNYIVQYTGPVLNEVMARNRSAVTNGLGEVSDWIEFFNAATTNVDLAGMSLSVDAIEPRQWVFPAGSVIPANGYLVVWCGDSRGPSTNSETYLNVGRDLDGDAGGVYLFNAGGQLVEAIEYGFQVENQSIGRAGAQWRLLASPTPAAANAASASLGSATNVVFNEWLADPSSGPDWFELFNVGTLPVELSGFFITDDPSLAGIRKSRFAPLSFIAGNGWVQVIADENPDQGRNHANFSLSGAGESIRLYNTTSNIITSVYFGAQLPGASQGRLPDGSAGIVDFPASASPAASNYLPPDNVIINEVLTHATAPLEDAVELYNPSTTAAMIGGWYLSDDSADLRKYRIPDGTVVQPDGYLTLSESQFNTGPKAFGLNRSRGNVLWLSQADGNGVLSGVRTRAEYGAALNGISIGSFRTRLTEEFVALSQRTVGAENAYAKVGPVVINEIMYHPPDIVTPTNIINNTDDEYIELYNISAGPVALANWRLEGGVDFTFGSAATLPAGGYALMVGFDPVINTSALNAFRTKYGLSPSVAIFGPYQGRLNNDSENIALYQPDIPEGGFVPSVLVERVNYTDAAPWPGAATGGGGLSMQRRVSSLFGNDALNWMAAQPSPAAANNAPIVALPVITGSPQSQTLVAGTIGNLTVAVNSSAPVRYQWRFNGLPIPGATNQTLTFSPAGEEHDGTYDVLVSNAGGSAFSETARLSIAAPATVVIPPQVFVVRPGTNVTFSVTAVGPGPINYQWRYQGANIPGATSRTLLLTNVQFGQSGDYEVQVMNPHATVTAAGSLVVLLAPIITHQPQSAVALVGDNVTFMIRAEGTTPMYYRWRRNTATVLGALSSTLTITNVQLTNSGTFFDVIITNRAFVSPGVRSDIVYLTVLADSDGDRMPDVWEDSNRLNSASNGDAGLDADADGMSNLAEYTAGTDPNDATSYLKIEQISVVANSTSLSLMALSNINYTVQYKDVLSSGAWSNLAHVFMQTNARVATIIDSNAAPSRYYRLVTPYQP